MLDAIDTAKTFQNFGSSIELKKKIVIIWFVELRKNLHHY